MRLTAQMQSRLSYEEVANRAKKKQKNKEAAIQETPH
jgi:hypothetical protein